MTIITTLNRRRVTTPGLRTQVFFTGSELEADPRTAAHAPVFLSLVPKVEAVFAEELVLEDEIIRASAHINMCGKNLFRFASLTSKTLLTIVADKRTHSLYNAYFSEKSLSDLQRARTGVRLTKMRGWIVLLEGSKHASLKALAPELIALIKVTDDAILAKQNAVQARKLFREEGARKQIFDEVNQTRKATHADLAKLLNEHPDLPADYPDRFFLQESVRRAADDEDEEDSADDVREAIEELKAKLALEEERLKKIEAAEKEKKEAERETTKAALAAIEKTIAEQVAKANALKEKLDTSV